MSIREVAKRSDRITAGYIDSVANIISGLELSPIGEDGHAVANKLWKITEYIKGRNASNGS